MTAESLTAAVMQQRQTHSAVQRSAHPLRDAAPYKPASGASIQSVALDGVALTDASAYRPLSAFKALEISDILKHDVICCVFANGALFAQKKLWFTVAVSCRNGVPDTSFVDIVGFIRFQRRWADGLVSYTNAPIRGSVRGGGQS